MSFTIVTKKFGKFSEGGLYEGWENYFVLNFEMERDYPTMPTVDYEPDRLFTFIFSENALYRGKECIERNVVVALPTPP